MINEPHKIKCPHPQCEGVMKINQNIPTGEYPCICKGCTVKLSWATYQDRGRVPYLMLVDKPKESK